MFLTMCHVKNTGISPPSLAVTTDVGSVENARSNFQPWTYALHGARRECYPCSSRQIKSYLIPQIKADEETYLED